MIYVDRQGILCYAIKQETNGRLCPNLMACSKESHGKCSRCGRVGKTHFTKPRPENSEEQERKQIVHAFFQEKRTYPKAKAQLRMFE